MGSECIMHMPSLNTIYFTVFKMVFSFFFLNADFKSIIFIKQDLVKMSK